MNRIAKELLKQKEAKKAPKVHARDLLSRWKIFKGDQVQVITGDDKGHIGLVTRVHRSLNRVIVQGANLARKHVKTGVAGQGAILDIEKGIHVSNVSLLDPSTSRPTSVAWMMVKDHQNPSAQRLARVATASGFEIPLPQPPPRERKEGPRDTNPALAVKKTYSPDLRIPPFPKGCRL